MICFTGFNENMITFECDSTVEIGNPVTVSGNAKVTKSADGAAFCGIARSVRDGCASVQVGGYMRVKFSGTAPAFGVTTIAANGNGGIKSGAGRTVTVLEVDYTTMECGFIL